MASHVSIKQVEILTRTLKDIHKRIKETREQAMSLASPDLQKEIACTSKSTDAAYTKLIDYCAELQSLCDKMLAEASEDLSSISQCIDAIHDRELKSIALMRYVQGDKIDDIAEKMHMDSRTVQRKLSKIKEFLKSVS